MLDVAHSTSVSLIEKTQGNATTVEHREMVRSGSITGLGGGRRNHGSVATIDPSLRRRWSGLLRAHVPADNERIVIQPPTVTTGQNNAEQAVKGVLTASLFATKIRPHGTSIGGVWVNLTEE